MANHLGDGVYVEFDGYCLILTTHNGYEELSRIFLEPEVYRKLVEYAESKGWTANGL